MVSNNEGKDITLSILKYYDQDYKTAKVNRIAMCIRLNLIYKSPDELLTDHFWMPLRDLRRMGYIDNGEYQKRLKHQRELLNGQVLRGLREKFEADTNEEARRRKS